jgi:hypothetical protein
MAEPEIAEMEAGRKRKTAQPEAKGAFGFAKQQLHRIIAG